ncbi:hypothetical protein Q9R29_01180 [Rothia sp. ARF10]|nr:hypothetical protein [Rothia sp. ARF10]
MSLGDVVDAQPAKVRPDSWSDLLGALGDRRDQVAKSGKISRRDVFDVARQSHSSHEWTSLLIASYIWGQGPNGYGPHRLRQILMSAPREGRHLEVCLREAVAAMHSGASVDGYRRLRGAVPGLGPAFFTKFLYFAAAASAAGGTPIPPDSQKPAPLILDAVVAKQVRAVVEARCAAPLQRLAGRGDEAAPLAAWLWSDSGWTPHRYGVWLTFAQSATQQLQQEIPAWPGRTDVFELAVFQKQLEP